MESLIADLMESANRSDEASVRRIQEGMRTIIGQELQSHRYVYDKPYDWRYLFSTITFWKYVLTAVGASLSKCMIVTNGFMIGILGMALA